MKIKLSSNSGGGRPSTTTTLKLPCPTPPPPQQWQSIVLPLIAGILHLRVFYYAVFGCILRNYNLNYSENDEESASSVFRRTCFLLDSSIFLAYTFDLVCCLCFRVLPFSRCNCSRDIVGHHVPTLLLALPLAIPLWSGYSSLQIFDPVSFAILDKATANVSGVAPDLRTDFINAYATASGYAYASSLNEVLMCLQRVEMSLAGVSYIRDVATKMSNQRRFFTSRAMLYAELSYKLVFFWGMSLVACKACFDFDWTVYKYYSSSISSSDNSNNNSSEHWMTTTIPLFLAVYTSPAVLRGVLFRLFTIVMYPSMGFRCLATMKRLHREGKGSKMMMYGEEDAKITKKNDDDTVTTIICDE